MKATPKGWPRLSTAIYYDDAAGAIDWLCRAFGFEVRLEVEGEGGHIAHSELVYGEALVMVASSGDRPRHPEFPRGASPRSIGGANTQSLMLFVDNVDEHCARVRRARPWSKSQPFTITARTTGRTAAMERSIRKAICGGSLSAYGIRRASNSCRKRNSMLRFPRWPAALRMYSSIQFGRNP